MQSVAYDETDNSLTIVGTGVQVGESIVIDGKKIDHIRYLRSCVEYGSLTISIFPR